MPAETVSTDVPRLCRPTEWAPPGLSRFKATTSTRHPKVTRYAIGQPGDVAGVRALFLATFPFLGREGHDKGVRVKELAD
jgi:hypothetical protein